ncbi:sel1 repeat family protein [Achromobacter aegrifaciens]|uniref:tetratricopeptide repeat protein n=1 Tax=Achromobacter aegrifaciens TaxID=1287736 RepID=UPI0027BA473A|nr:sel1 repeat family protein [Achromobacter aegrifaciens]WLW64979.1 sel1 repeat family protein [Achromobacter aegrifaciens]
MSLRPLLLSVLILMAGCAQHSSADGNVRICDASGCSQRSKQQVSFDDAQPGPDENADASIVALKAEAEKDPRAAYDLALRYFRGDGVRQDSHQALVWMRSAAESGDLGAQKALGSFYLAGLEEMGPDPQEAEKWLAIAVSGGDDASRPLLQQASAAKQNEHAYFRWKREWSDVYRRLWQSGYPYRGHWQVRVWSWR